MSTVARDLPLNIARDRCSELLHFLETVGDARHLLGAERLAMRMHALDDLDAIIGGPDLADQDLPPQMSHTEAELIARANALRSHFEAVNERLCEGARVEISDTGNSPAMARWLADLIRDGKTDQFRPGLGFDLLDDFVSGVFQFRGPEESGPLSSREMVPYQPTPVRHILDLVAACRFSSDDLLVDLGSGLGHVPLLVSILTGVRTLGIEVQPDHAASAREVAQALHLGRVRFVAEDARTADLSSGTVFYLFSPFTGSILSEVLSKLRQQSEDRPIRICSLGPCTRILQGQAWLRANQPPDTERITLFRSQRVSRRVAISETLVPCQS